MAKLSLLDNDKCHLFEEKYQEHSMNYWKHFLYILDGRNEITCQQSDLSHLITYKNSMHYYKN